MRLSLALAVVGVANAGIMTFDPAAPGRFLTTTFEQDGIRLTVIAGHYDLWGCAGILCPDPRGVVAGTDSMPQGPSTLRITLVSGGLFYLDSIQLLSPGGGFLVASNGTRSDAGFPGGTPAGFRGIQYFDISSSVDQSGGYLFDTIVLTPVPEPATFALTLLGFAIGASRIRRILVHSKPRNRAISKTARVG